MLACKLEKKNQAISPQDLRKAAWVGGCGKDMSTWQQIWHFWAGVVWVELQISVHV